MNCRSIKAAIAKAAITKVAITKVVVAGTGRTRHAELLILCARVDFNP